jgi:hypothetical protein
MPTRMLFCVRLCCLDVASLWAGHTKLHTFVCEFVSEVLAVDELHPCNASCKIFPFLNLAEL